MWWPVPYCLIPSHIYVGRKTHTTVECVCVCILSVYEGEGGHELILLSELINLCVYVCVCVCVCLTTQTGCFME